MATIPEHIDLVVAGAGIGGLCAARSAQEAGLSVLVVEKAPEIGGSAAASGGTVWCARDIAEWQKVQPDGDTLLGQALITGFNEGIPWLVDQGVEITEIPDRPYKFKRDIFRLDPTPRAALQTLARKICEDGGHILTSASLDGLDRSDVVSGVSVRTENTKVRVETHSAILATGGFQASAELRARFMGKWSDRMVVRGVPENTGGGLLAGMDIGADTAGPFDRFYGHYLPAPPAKIGLHNYVHVKPDFSEYAITVNVLGERFDDEFLGDEVTVHALIHQPEAMGVLIFDQHIRDNMEKYSQWPTADVDRVKNIREAGGEVLECSSPERLAEEMDDRWQIPKVRFLNTLAEYNTACHQGSGADLTVPKSGGLIPLKQPPFYAIRVLAGATFTYGGVRVNASAEVLDPSGAPIGGLYAAGADCGGVYTRGYTGGLSMGLAFGRIAGRNAGTYVRSLNA